jgi:hypothetical protein
VPASDLSCCLGLRYEIFRTFASSLCGFRGSSLQLSFIFRPFCFWVVGRITCTCTAGLVYWGLSSGGQSSSRAPCFVVFRRQFTSTSWWEGEKYIYIHLDVYVVTAVTSIFSRTSPRCSGAAPVQAPQSPSDSPLYRWAPLAWGRSVLLPTPRAAAGERRCFLPPPKKMVVVRSHEVPSFIILPIVLQQLKGQLDMWNLYELNYEEGSGGIRI